MLTTTLSETNTTQRRCACELRNSLQGCDQQPHEIFLHLSLQMRLEKPQTLIYGSRDFREQISGVRVVEMVRLINRGSSQITVNPVTFRKRLEMRLPFDRLERIGR